MHLRHGPDIDIVNQSHKAYADADVEVAHNKAFGGACSDSMGNCPGEYSFLAWGSEVDSEAGTVGTPV
eukprot:6344412-Karenia_brevis.AAC.1